MLQFYNSINVGTIMLLLRAWIPRRCETDVVTGPAGDRDTLSEANCTYDTLSSGWPAVLWRLRLLWQAVLMVSWAAGYDVCCEHDVVICWSTAICSARIGCDAVSIATWAVSLSRLTRDHCVLLFLRVGKVWIRAVWESCAAPAVLREAMAVSVRRVCTSGAICLRAARHVWELFTTYVTQCEAFARSELRNFAQC